MSQEDLAAKSGVSLCSIQNYESGETCPLLQNAYAIAEALGRTVNDLCGLGDWK